MSLERNVRTEGKWFCEDESESHSCQYFGKRLFLCQKKINACSFRRIDLFLHEIHEFDMKRTVFFSVVAAFALSVLPLQADANALTATDVAAPSTTAMSGKKDKVKTEKDIQKEEAKKVRKHAKYEAKQAKKQAKKQKEQAKAVARAEKEAQKLADKMAKLQPVRCYLWGAGMNFLDSIVYVTDYQYLDSIYIEPDGQLRDHYAYTAAIKFYVESTFGETNETCAVFYGDDDKKQNSRYQKMLKNMQKKGFVVNVIPKKEFAFTKEDDGTDDFTKSVQNFSAKPSVP